MTATQILTDWLNQFGSALEQGDVNTAVDLFADDCYWRDLVTFTWNIKTMEGKEQIADMLNARLGDVKPSNWELDGEANHDEENDIVDGWINFETDVSRGRGQIRLLGGKGWTLLTTMVELKGHEEPKGTTRPMGVEHGVFKGRKNWLERRQQEEAELGYKEQSFMQVI